MKLRFHAIGAALVGLALAASPSAMAQSCDDIMNMVNVNVPTNIIVQTMESSGKLFDNAEIRCLEDGGAPAEVVDAAKKLSASAKEPEPEITREKEIEKTRPSDDWEETERLGEDTRRSGAREFEDLPEEGEGKDTTACGRQVDDAVEMYRARKPLGASKLLYDMLDDGTCPEQTTKVHYYLARALLDLEMYHSAQYYFMQVVQRGPADPYFKHALPKVVAIARYTGDDSELLRIVPRIPPEEYPRQAKNHLYYLMGVRLYDQDKLSDARNYFAQISTKSDLYLKSKYFEGVIYNRQGRLKSAVKSFRDVIRDSESVDIFTDQELEEVENLADLSS
ncbi:MAG: hypothetical protein H6739_16210 [Alphaproteobacteria bacterium]|nr:hypothetical protein [Alphaproteobacteria bacterium]